MGVTEPLEGGGTGGDAGRWGADASHYRELADLLPDAVYETDARLLFTYANRTAFTMFGYEPADLDSGLDLLSLLHEDDRERARTNLKGVVRGERSGPTTYKMQRKDGSVLWCDVTCAPIFDSDDVLAGFRGAVRDVSGLKQTEEALHVNEEHLRSLFATSPSITYSLLPEGDGFTIVWVSQNIERILGYDSAQALSRDFWEQRLLPTDRQRVFRFVRQLETKEEVIVEYPFRRADGEYRWLRDRMRITGRDGTGHPLGIVGTWTDISEQREADEARRASEARYHELVDSLPDGIFSCDLDYRFTSANRAIGLVAGRPTDEVVGRTPAELGFEDDTVRRWSALLTRVLDTGGPTEGELEVVLADGMVHTLEANLGPLVGPDGALAGIRGIVRDVTMRREAERALVESEERYRAVVESSPDAIVVYVGRSIVYANPAAALLTAVDGPEALLGASVFDYIHPEFREFATVRMRRAFVERETLPPAEERLIRPDGTVVDVEIIAVPMSYKGQQAVTVMVRDLSASKAAERALRESEEQLRQGQKMEAIGRLAGGIAHDFNNLLTPMIGCSDLLLQDMSPDDRRRADVEEIRRAADRAASLTRQLLAFSRRQPLQPRVLNLNDVVLGLQSLLGRLLGAQVTLSTCLEPALLPVEVDPVQFEQVVMNLALNARDAMPGGGRLTVETANGFRAAGDEDEPPGGAAAGRDDEHGNEFPAVRFGAHVVLTVRDTGSGIESGLLGHIFEPFFTTKRLGEGTGLGLSTVYGIVRQSGGSIRVASEPGQGATFTIRLPAVLTGVAVPERRVAESPEEAVGGTEVVMIVEDEAPVLNLVTRVLRRLGYTILEAGHGEAALAMLSTTSRLDLLLTDVVLPGVGGRELADAAQLLFPDLRTLFMSGYARDSVVRDGRVVQGIAFLEKPFTPQQLARKVREVLDAARPA